MGLSEIVTGAGAFILGVGADRYLPYFFRTKAERDRLNEKRVEDSRDRKIEDLKNLRSAVAAEYDFWTRWNQNPSRPKNKDLNELDSQHALFTAAATGVMTFAEPSEQQDILWFAGTFASWYGTVAKVPPHLWEDIFADADADDFLEAHAVLAATIRRMLDEV